MMLLQSIDAMALESINIPCLLPLRAGRPTPTRIVSSLGPGLKNCLALKRPEPCPAPSHPGGGRISTLTSVNKLTHDEGQKKLCDARHESSWIGCAGIIPVSNSFRYKLGGRFRLAVSLFPVSPYIGTLMCCLCLFATL